METKKIEVYGRVQSVGFRPFIYNLAKKFGLNGYVRNRTSFVEILVQGNSNSLEKFLSNIKNLVFPIFVEKLLISNINTKNLYSSFDIIESKDSYKDFIYISADIKICDECIKELFDKNNRRYLYPFINCTKCGPRFTIIKNLPYDRINTTMNIFKMCKECYDEYNDYRNRRFHCQPNACYSCGPGLELIKNKKRILGITKSQKEIEEILDFITKEILNGKIFAIKSYGGYHFLCDATNDSSVLRLRKNKYREFKPFAMMASSVDIIKKYCYLNDKEEKILKSSYAPIVLLFKKQNKKVKEISKYVAEKSLYFGFMLPYTALHYLIFYWLNNKYKKDTPLVMTSANITDEPQVYKDDDAILKFNNVVDYILTYNRDINIRCDDSVVKVFNNNLVFIRRSRGYAPEPLFLNFNFNKSVLSFGSDFKNTFSLAKKNYLINSQYIGDLDNVEVINSYKKFIKYYLNVFKFRPDIIVYDLHPNFISTQIAKDFAEKNKVSSIGVQHHYAHMLSCILENSIFDEKVIGVIFDGTGYGLDGKLWGSEFLLGDKKSFIRVGHFDYIKLLGLHKSIKEPYISALGLLYESNLDLNLIRNFLKEIFKRHSFKDVIGAIKFMIENKDYVYSCGMGRIFDIVAFFCKVGFINHYEGQLPCELETLAYRNFDKVKSLKLKYKYKIIEEQGILKVDTKNFLIDIFNDIFLNKIKVDEAAAKFHYTIVDICINILLKIRNKFNINKVVLSGGVFQNNLLFSTLIAILKNNNFEVFTNKQFPLNDSCISLGQILAAMSK